MSDLQDATTAIKLFADLSTAPTHKDGVLLIAKMLRQERRETRTRTLEEVERAIYKVMGYSMQEDCFARKIIKEIATLKASSGEERGETDER